MEYKTSEWQLEPDGKHVSFTDGHSIGRMKLMGTRAIAPFAVAQIKRVSLLKRADGYSVQFAVQAERRLDHQPTGKQIGIDVELKRFSPDSDGNTVDNPR